MAIKFDKKVECNDEFVALRMINNGQNMKIGGIYVPDTTAQNNRLGHYVIESIGKTAKEEFGLNVGDYVMADKLSSYGHTEPIALMDYKNIICKTNSDKSNYYPLKNMVFVQPDKLITKNKIINIFKILFFFFIFFSFYLLSFFLYFN